MNKKMFSIFLILIMLFSLSVPAFAWTDENIEDNYASQEIIDNAPPFKTGNYIVVVYGSTYYSFGSEYESVNFYVDLEQNKILNVDENGNSLGFAYSIWNSDGQYWTGDGAIADWGSDGFYLVGFTSDDVTLRVNDLQIKGGTPTIESVIFTDPLKTLYNVGDTFDSTGITVTANYSDGTSKDVTSESVITPPDLSVAGMNVEGKIEYGIWTYTFIVNVEEVEIIVPDDGTEEDINNSGLLGGIKDFFSNLFDGLLELSDFLWDIIYKIGDFFKSIYNTLLKIPELIKSLDTLFGEDSVIFEFLDSIFPEDNQNAQNALFIVIMIFTYGLFMFLYTLVKKFLLK